MRRSSQHWRIQCYPFTDRLRVLPLRNIVSVGCVCQQFDLCLTPSCMCVCIQTLTTPWMYSTLSSKTIKLQWKRMMTVWRGMTLVMELFVYFIKLFNCITYLRYCTMVNWYSLNIIIDYRSYLAWVSRVNRAISFFHQQHNFKSADKALRKLVRRLCIYCAHSFIHALHSARLIFYYFFILLL